MTLVIHSELMRLRVVRPTEAKRRGGWSDNVQTDCCGKWEPMH
ncbi:MAG TPA: hypothetical protein VLB12_08265 [Gemmatimonadales bacterium]|nr:hypothetical protein [Gemmatimonadales bacterium]